LATITFKKGDDYALKLAKLGDRTEEICKKAIYPAAGIVANQINANLKANLDDPEYVGKLPNILFKNSGRATTGDLFSSFGISPIKLGTDGYYSCKIGFDGYDQHGVPNQLKARAMESGTSKLRKRPFVRPAVKATQKKALESMKKVVDEECQTTMKE